MKCYLGLGGVWVICVEVVGLWFLMRRVRAPHCGLLVCGGVIWITGTLFSCGRCGYIVGGGVMVVVILGMWVFSWRGVMWVQECRLVKIILGISWLML